jgi:hypothetical protein
MTPRELGAICATLQARGCYGCGERGHGTWMLVPNWEGPDAPAENDELTDVRLELTCVSCGTHGELRLRERLGDAKRRSKP